MPIEQIVQQLRAERDRLFTTLKGDKIVAEFIQILDEYVELHYTAKVEVTAK